MANLSIRDYLVKNWVRDDSTIIPDSHVHLDYLEYCRDHGVRNAQSIRNFEDFAKDIIGEAFDHYSKRDDWTFRCYHARKLG